MPQSIDIPTYQRQAEEKDNGNGNGHNMELELQEDTVDSRSENYELPTFLRRRMEM